MDSLRICDGVFKWCCFSEGTVQQWNPASDHLLKLLKGLKAAIIYLSKDCKLHFYSSAGS